MTDLAARTARKIEIRLVYPLVLLLFLNSIDRVNISFGALKMNQEIGLTPSSYGFGASLFFVGYILFQIPSVWALNRWGARLWLFGVVGAWGCIATAMAFIHTPHQFYVVRTLLGFAEAGFAPGVIYLTSTWMPVRNRATALAIAMMAVPLSLILGGPICAWLMGLHNPANLSGWRWMSLTQGATTLVLAFACLALFVDDPKDAGWLSPEEKSGLAAELQREDAASPVKSPLLFRQLVLDARVWLSAVMWFSLLLGLYGVIFWLPQIIKQVAGGDPLQISLITDVPWIAALVGTLVNAKHSDRTQERFWHFSLSMVLAGLGLAVAVWSHSAMLSLAALVLAGLGLGGAQGTFWTMPPLFLGRSKATTGVAFINMLGNSSGILGPWIIGVLREQTGSFTAPIYILALVLAAAGLVAIILRRMLTKGLSPVPAEGLQ